MSCHWYGDSKMPSEQQQFIDDAGAIGVPLTEDQAARALRLLDELVVWNRTYSLTAITERERMIRAHLLDSLSAYPELPAAHRRRRYRRRLPGPAAGAGRAASGSSR